MKKILNRSRKKRIVLGSGDVNNKSQQFKLPKEISTSSNLQDIIISVSKNRWMRVDTLEKSSPSDRDYIIRREENGEVSIQFGDGVNGRKPPSGKNNVTASYNSGVGAEGNIKNISSKRKKLVKKAKVKKSN